MASSVAQIPRPSIFTLNKILFFCFLTAVELLSLSSFANQNCSWAPRLAQILPVQQGGKTGPTCRRAHKFGLSSRFFHLPSQPSFLPLQRRASASHDASRLRLPTINARHLTTARMT